MLVVADFNQFSGQFFFFKTRGCRCFLFPRVDYSLHNHYYYRPLVHLNSQRIIIIMNGQKSGSSVPQLQSSSPLSERQFFFPTDHNCSTLTLQCKLHLKEGIQLHNRSTRTSCTTFGWSRPSHPSRVQEKSGSLIYRHISLMNHEKTHQTNSRII